MYIKANWELMSRTACTRMRWANMQYSAGSALAKSAECKTILQKTQSPIEMAMVVKQPAKPYKRLASWELLHITTYVPRHIRVYEYMFNRIVYSIPAIHFFKFLADNKQWVDHHFFPYVAHIFERCRIRTQRAEGIAKHATIEARLLFGSHETSPIIWIGSDRTGRSQKLPWCLWGGGVSTVKKPSLQ